MEGFDLSTWFVCTSKTFPHRLPQIYEEFYHTVNNADHEKDLRWWANNHGVNMAMNWPQFEVRSTSFAVGPIALLWTRGMNIDLRNGLLRTSTLTTTYYLHGFC